MGRRQSTTGAGLSVTEHQRLARECAAVVAQVEALRATVREGLSSASEPYGCCNHVLSGLRRLQSALVADLALSHGDTLGMAQVRAVYGHRHGEG